MRRFLQGGLNNYKKLFSRFAAGSTSVTVTGNNPTNLRKH